MVFNWYVCVFVDDHSLLSWTSIPMSYKCSAKPVLYKSGSICNRAYVPYAFIYIYTTSLLWCGFLWCFPHIRRSIYSGFAWLDEHPCVQQPLLFNKWMKTNELFEDVQMTMFCCFMLYRTRIFITVSLVTGTGLLWNIK